MPNGLLPLFPLGLVLFPRTPLPLHVFEDRYKEMIGEALRDDTEFGVVLANDKGIVNVGCTAVIERVNHRYPDGRLDIATAGSRRFEITGLNEERSFLQGEVEYFDDEDDDPGDGPLRMRVREEFEALRTFDELAQSVEPLWADRQLSFQLAQAIPDLGFRQTLLALRSEAERMKQLAEFLGGYRLKQKQVAHVKQVAPRNGHGKVPVE